MRLLLFLLLAVTSHLSAQQVPVYLYFASHTETTDQNFHGLNYSNPADYALMRAYVQRVCDTLLHYNAPYDMMLESTFILGCLKNENAATNPDDIIEWASRQPGFSVQPHNHFKPTGLGANPYNYADLVHLLNSCGVDSAYVMGGFIWRNFTSPVSVNEDWTQWQTPQPGYTFPAFHWRPTLLWGGGSPNHIDDFDAYGVWKPKASTTSEFGQHAPDNTLVNFGGGCSDAFVLWDTTNAAQLAYRIMNFADSVQAHYHDNPNAFFNMKVMMNFRHFPSPGYADKLGTVLRIIEPYIQAGKVQYSGILETWNAWKTLHPDAADYFEVSCEESVAISSVKPTGITGTQYLTNNSIPTIYPNPAHDYVQFSQPVEQMIMYDFMGNPVIVTKDVQRISVEGLPVGIYLLSMDQFLVKLIVE